MTAERDSTMTLVHRALAVRLEKEGKRHGLPDGWATVLIAASTSIKMLADAIDANLTRNEVVSAEDRFEQYVATLIDHSADIQKLGEWLGNRLDEDDFNTVEPMILGIAEKLKEVSRKVAVPDGYVLVPAEPTEAMVNAGSSVPLYGQFYPGHTAEESEQKNEAYCAKARRIQIYKAMLASQDEVK